MTPKAIDHDYGRHRLSEFGLDPSLIHANHGAYGAVPEPVRAAQRQIQEEVRRNPSGFFRSEYPARIRAAAERVAEFLGGDAEDWVFVENATQACNTVIASLGLSPGEEVLTTDQVYGAVRKAIQNRCENASAKLVEAQIRLPLSGPDDIIVPVLDAVTDKTRLVVLDHISSPCGIIFPVAELCAHLHERGILVLIDGAHAPGNIDVDVTALCADFYAGNAHKWLCAPQGAAVLWCHAEYQERLQPLTVSHGHGLGFTHAFDWPGTRDPSAWLSVPAAIDIHIDAGDEALRLRNRDVAFAAARALADQFGTVLAAPKDMQCSMATIRLPGCGMLQADRLEALQQELQSDQNVVVSLKYTAGATWLRLSAAIYNDADDLIEAGRRVWSLIERKPGHA